MPEIRHASVADAALITQQRHQMFADNQLATEERFAEMDANFLPWVTERLADGRYVGLLLEEEGQVIAGAGIFFMDFPPHYLDPEPVRAYLLNFYTAPDARGRGLARLLLEAAVAECRRRGVAVITLHASRFGKPVYERFGFTLHNEYVLRPDGSVIPQP